MENFGNDFLDYLVDDDYYDVANFDDDSSFGDDETQRSSDVDSLDSDFDDDFEMVYCLCGFLFLVLFTLVLVRGKNNY